MKPYKAATLPLNKDMIDSSFFYEELIDAVTKLEVYKEKINDSKLDSYWFMPTLQQKEALASSMLEGTQATIDGVLINKAVPNKKSKDLKEVENYFRVTERGYRYLARERFSKEFVLEIHKDLLENSERNDSSEVGKFRKKQNYIGKTNGDHGLVFTPPVPEDVEGLMENLVDYIVNPKDKLRPLVRTAIIHGQFLTIHPFMDGNGRVGRILIPLYMYYCKEIQLPCFFISEALERDKFKYYKYLNGIRTDNDWNSWIKFFLETVTKQCIKYIQIISDLNKLYDEDLKRICDKTGSNKMVELMNLLYEFPVITPKIVVDRLKIAPSTANRYLKQLVDEEILFTDEKKRYRTFFYYDLLAILRK